MGVECVAVCGGVDGQVPEAVRGRDWRGSCMVVIVVGCSEALSRQRRWPEGCERGRSTKRACGSASGYALRFAQDDSISGRQLLCFVADDVEEELVDAGVFGEFGVEGGGEECGPGG